MRAMNVQFAAFAVPAIFFTNAAMAASASIDQMAPLCPLPSTGTNVLSADPAASKSR